MLGDKEEMGMTEVTRNGIDFKASHDVRKKSASSTINPTIRIPLQDVYRTRSNLFFISFWAILFIMTNFVFFYFSINDFQISQIAWYATVVIFVFALTMSYLLHTWYDCLAYAIPGGH
ncbi:hypothetical protein AAMO2058_000196600 [Amorphochlora amoebiformis]